MENKSKGTCLTQDNLQKGRIILSNRCYMCEEELETANQLLIYCEGKVVLGATP